VHTLLPPDDAGYETAEEALAWWDRTYPDMQPSRMTSLVIPTLLEVGVSSADIERMTRANPKAIFDNQAPY
jgi:predicted metal-dependent phosphotriesterase family hydrolase